MLEVTIEEALAGAMQNAERLLGDMPGATEAAMRAATGRAGQHMKTRMAQRIRERYKVKASDIKENSTATVHTKKAADGVDTSVNIRGKRIPLFKFGGASPKQPTNQPKTVVVKTKMGWRRVHPGVAASGHQLTSTSPTKFKNAFVARMPNGHVGIYERTGGMTASGLEEIREIMADAPPQMVENNGVAEQLAYDGAEKFAERFDHEILAIANGWRSY